MNMLNRLVSLVGLVGIVALFLALNIFIGLYLISLAVVPLTWAYAAAVGRSYEFVIHQSEMLYQINRFGRLAWLVTACLAVAYVAVWANLLAQIK